MNTATYFPVYKYCAINSIITGGNESDDTISYCISEASESDEDSSSCCISSEKSFEMISSIIDISGNKLCKGIVTTMENLLQHILLNITTPKQIAMHFILWLGIHAQSIHYTVMTYSLMST